MTLNITSKQMDITPAIREHVEGRLAKLEKWHTQLISPHFVLSKVPNGFSPFQNFHLYIPKNQCFLNALFDLLRSD